MFASLVNTLGGTQADVEEVLQYDAGTISFLMEAAWSRGGPGVLVTVPLPDPAPIGVDLPGLRMIGHWDVSFDHLIYAAMIENTRAYEILGRVIAEYTSGERLGIPQRDATFQWLRTTEELFYKDASPFQPYNLVSRIRPDVAASRRNAYYRMFGMDLNHGRDGAAAYPYLKPAVANRDFVPTFEEFLRETWRAIENANNLLANNPTDFPAIVDLAIRLQNMLTARRGGAADRPNLSREEFLAVSLMSWIDLTFSINSPIVQDLVATGPSPEERLRQVGERVGLPAHARSHSYFIIAPLISTLLIEIENGDYSTRAGAETLAGGGTVQAAISDIIHHWSLITGRDMKAPRLGMSALSGAASSASLIGSSMMSMPGTEIVAAAPSSNGRTPVPSS